MLKISFMTWIDLPRCGCALFLEDKMPFSVIIDGRKTSGYILSLQ